MQHINSQGNSSKAEWKIRINTILWFVLIIGFLLSLPILFDWGTWLLAVVLVISLVLGGPVAWIARRVFGRNKQHTFVGSWFKSGAALLCIFSFGLAAPIYYLAAVTETRPIIFPQVTLTNGKKTVVFQGMQHVGSENFYKSVIYDVEKAIADGYVIYYESVQTATPESKEFFTKLSSELTGNTDLASAYKILGETCGLKFQSDYFTLLDTDKREHPDRHVIADVDAIELKHEYERLMKSDPEFAKAHAGDFKSKSENNSQEKTTNLVEWLQSGTEGQKKLSGVICRGIMTLAYAPKEIKKSGKFDPLILDYRNRALVKQIIEDPHDKIFITYGANHFSGVFDLLMQQDSGWSVATVKWMRTIEMPKREHEGKLVMDAS